MFKTMGHNHKPSAATMVKCPGFFAVLDDVPKESPAGLQKLSADLNNCNKEFPPNHEPSIPNNTQTKDEKIRDIITKPVGSNIANWVTAMSDGSNWPTRYHNSSYANTVSQWIAGEFEKLAGDRATAANADVHIRLVDHRNTNQKSVEVRIDGTEASNDPEFVILGGHLDSIHSQTSRFNPDSRSPGADDNASGISILLETFRVLMAEDYRPKKPIVFYGYAAEEIGLVGSQEIANSYRNDNKTVLGVMQIDMAMYSTTNTNTIRLLRDYTSNNLTNLAQGLAEDYIGLTVESMTCGYACSDHASWSQVNYPAFMPAEDQFRDSAGRIHTSNDLVDGEMSGEYAKKFSQLALAYIISLTYE